MIKCVFIVGNLWLTAGYTSVNVSTANTVIDSGRYVTFRSGGGAGAGITIRKPENAGTALEIVQKCADEAETELMRSLEDVPF